MARTVSELKTWRVGTLALAMLAIAIFCIQRFVTQIFDVAFEICIFYIPTVTIIIYVFHLSREKGQL